MLKMERASAKEEIQKAFMQLFLQKPYMEITVSDVVNKAQVARMSFYRNFNSLDDVMESLVDDMLQDFNAGIIPALKENNERKWRELLFEMLYRSIQLRRQMGASFTPNGNVGVLMSRMHDKILRAESDLPVQDAKERYSDIGKLNLIQGIIHEWLITGMRETPEEIVDIIMPMIMKL